MRHGSPGVQLVKAKRYALQDSMTGMEISWAVPFQQAARPGQQLAMSMVFNGDWINGDVKNVNEAQNPRETKPLRELKCPSCSRMNEVDDTNIEVTWYAILSPVGLRLPENQVKFADV